MRIAFVCLSLMLSLSSLTFSAVVGLSSDGITLLALATRWTSVPPPIAYTWNASDSTPCSWAGVRCNRHGLVSALNLSSYAISGHIGPEIGDLNHLESADFNTNCFSGPIPTHLGNCTLLDYLDLSGNNLTGKIPEGLGTLQKLRFLSLFSNALSGSIPDSLFGLPQLETIYLSYNQLSGPIPWSAGNSSGNLVSIWLDNNRLSGLIPSSIGNRTTLRELYLNNNRLVGSLPGNLGNLRYMDVHTNGLGGSIPLTWVTCEELTYLDLSFNRFGGSIIPPVLGNCSGLQQLAAVRCGLTGPIPSVLGQLSGLTVLHLSENRLSGRIPPELGNCKWLSDLQLDGNQLEGGIPTKLGMLTGLKNLFLFSNHLTGQVPIGIWKIHSLESLLLYDNDLFGELPAELAELKRLERISLFDNHFSGVIPQGLGVNSSLLVVDFTNNTLSGPIPPNLCFGKQLQRLTLGFNNLQGGVPPDLGSCSSLTRLILKQNNLSGILPDFSENPNLSFLDLQNNGFIGDIPASLGNLWNITWIDLSMNKLSGSVPQELGNLVKLQALNLSYNILDGPLSSRLSNCSKLLQLDVSNNLLNGSIPVSLESLTALSTLDLSENRISGGIPPFFFQLQSLSNLQLGGNLFDGDIPSSIGPLPNLNKLNLSWNGLTGDIPLDIGDLLTLEHLDISHNNLTGTLVPLGGVQSLTELNVSYNSFSGQIPATLLKFLNFSFLGNPGLCINCGFNCVAHSSNLRPCALQHNKKEKALSELGIAMVALGSTLFVVVVLAVSLALSWCREPKHEIEIFAKEGPSSLLTKVIEATENFNEKHIIGGGAHGTVYKASLGPDRVYAVKKVGFGGLKEASRSMVREIQTVGKLRHRNLVRLEDFWLRKEYGLILYSYLPNGSLHDVLHEIRPPPILGWDVRFKIALGAALGLEYLHFDCDPAVVHRDIKSMNILLDSDMEAHISDFGIAMLLDDSDALPTATLRGTVGYIAPENAFTTGNSKESDIYSYGVVLLELVTRRKALDSSFVEEVDIVGWVSSVWNSTQSMGMITDQGLLDEFFDVGIMEQVSATLLLALRCTDKDPIRRPSMREVVKRLESMKSVRSMCAP